MLRVVIGWLMRMALQRRSMVIGKLVVGVVKRMRSPAIREMTTQVLPRIVDTAFTQMNDTDRKAALENLYSVVHGVEAKYGLG